ncbi:hypothetical protein COO60DRAFT_782207 [Scenedesmus sp. NREL 46B-D3]|nr:hypothetical protein COO60DRAFT_782207 [Scenedesmus sp. NREL 46B-D3]
MSAPHLLHCALQGVFLQFFPLYPVLWAHVYTHTLMAVPGPPPILVCYLSSCAGYVQHHRSQRCWLHSCVAQVGEQARLLHAVLIKLPTAPLPHLQQQQQQRSAATGGSVSTHVRQATRTDEITAIIAPPLTR